MFKICRSFEISCSHKLGYCDWSKEQNEKVFGKCANEPSHGHNYRIELLILSDTLEDGMVMNFSKVKEIFKRLIEDKFDHRYLNDVMSDIPTAENMALLFFNILNSEISQLKSVRIYETSNCWAEYNESL